MSPDLITPTGSAQRRHVFTNEHEAAHGRWMAPVMGEKEAAANFRQNRQKVQ